MTDDASSAERAAVVKWLRGLPVHPFQSEELRCVATAIIQSAANAIERGDHLTPDPQEHLARRGR